MTGFDDPGHPVRDRADASGEFSRVSARVVMLAAELGRITARSRLTIPATAVENIRDAHRMLGTLLARAPEPIAEADGERQPKVTLTDPPD